MLNALSKQLQQELSTLAQDSKTPGFSVGLIFEGQRQSFSYGFTNTLHPLPVTADTVFQLGSVSKVYTTLAAMCLVEEGLLELDRPVCHDYPEFRPSDPRVYEQITLRHLLTHSAGFAGDYDHDAGRGDDCLERTMLAVSAAPQWTRPGAIAHYSNLGFVLAGHIIACAVGQPFEEVVRSRVIEPLGLTNTSYYLEDLVAQRLAAGHDLIDGEPHPNGWVQPRSRGPNGGLLSTLTDQLTFISAVLDQRTPISADAAALMQTPHFPFGPSDSIGLGWFVHDLGGVHCIGHAGATPGFGSQLLIVPDQRIGMVVLVNSNDGAALITRANELFKARVANWSPPGLEAQAMPVPAGLDGSYGAVFGPRFVITGQSVRVDAGPTDPQTPEVAARMAMRFEDNTPVKLQMLGEDHLRFVRDENEQTLFDCRIERDEQGNIFALRLGPRILPRIVV